MLSLLACYQGLVLFLLFSFTDNSRNSSQSNVLLKNSPFGNLVENPCTDAHLMQNWTHTRCRPTGLPCLAAPALLSEQCPPPLPLVLLAFLVRECVTLTLPSSFAHLRFPFSRGLVPQLCAWLTLFSFRSAQMAPPWTQFTMIIPSSSPPHSVTAVFSL